MAGSTPDSDGHTPAPALVCRPAHAASPEGRPWVLAGYVVVTIAALTCLRRRPDARRHRRCPQRRLRRLLHPAPGLRHRRRAVGGGRPPRRRRRPGGLHPHGRGPRRLQERGTRRRRHGQRAARPGLPGRPADPRRRRRRLGRRHRRRSSTRGPPRNPGCGCCTVPRAPAAASPARSTTPCGSSTPRSCSSSTPTTSPSPRRCAAWSATSATPAVGAVMGRCVIRNGKESTMAATVFVDYLSGYLVNEYGRQALFELPAYGGANCAVRMSTLRALGGWNPETVTEDTDLTLRILHGRPAGALRRHRDRLRGSRRHRQAVLDAALPLGPRPPEVPARLLAAADALAAPLPAGEGRDDAVPARLPRAGAQRRGRCCSPSCAPSGSATCRPSRCCRCRCCCSSARWPSCAWACSSAGSSAGRPGACWASCPSFALAIGITTRAYVDGMLGPPVHLGQDVPRRRHLDRPAGRRRRPDETRPPPGPR